MANIFKSKYTGEQIEEILDRANNVTDITPNPEEEATEELQKITIGGTTFSIPKGVTVEGNPSGDATVELTKLKVGDVIYSIPQGSGGNGGGNLGHTITVPTGVVVTKVYFADGTSQNNPSGTTFSNVIAIEFNVTPSILEGGIEAPLGIRTYATNSVYANETFTTRPIPVTMNNTVYVKLFPLADGNISLVGGGGSD